MSFSLPTPQSMGWSDLPVELQTIVFQNFLRDQKNLKQLSIVCKGWLSTAQITLYTDVHLTEGNFVSFVNCISNGSAIRGESIVTINVRVSDDFCRGIGYSMFASLEKIVKYCPNVRLVDIDSFVIPYLYETLKTASVKEIWKKLREFIVYPDFFDMFSYHRQLLCMFSDSLENIKFTSDSPSDPVTDTAGYSFLQLCDTVDYLQQFPKVKILKLGIGDAHVNFQEYDAVLDKIPSTVKDLKLSSNHRIRYTPLGRENKDDTFCAMTENVTKIDTLEILKANIPIIHTRNIRYILYKFPRLISLKLSNTATSSTGVMEYYMPRTMLQQIIDRALLMREMDICGLRLSNETELLDMLIVEKQLVNELVLARNENYEIDHTPCCVLDIKKRTQDRKNVMSIMYTYFYNYTLTYKIQDQHELIKKYGDKIVTLTVDHSRDAFPDFRPKDCLYIVYSTLHNCPLLKTLIFKGVDLRYLGLSTVTTVNQNHSIKTLAMIDRTVATKEAFYFLSQRLPSLEELSYEIPRDKSIIEKGLPGYVDNSMEKEFASYLNRKNEVHIDMPYNQFERIKIHFYDAKVCTNRLCFIKLTARNTIRHFVCFQRCNRKIRKLMTTCSEAVFQDLLSKKTFQHVPYFIIKCKSLKKLQFTSEGSESGEPVNRTCYF